MGKPHLLYATLTLCFHTMLLSQLTFYSSNWLHEMLTDKNIYGQKTFKIDKYTRKVLFLNFLAYSQRAPHQIAQNSVMMFAQC